MGLDAHVFCNCLRERRVKSAPPVPLEQIYVDVAEGLLEIDYPEGLDQKAQDDLWYAVHRWARHSCEHENMYYCNVRVGSWSSVRTLQEAILASGNYPVLSSIFPSNNGGIVEVDTARSALMELENFRAEMKGQQSIFLVDAHTEDTIYSYINCYDGIFSMDGKQGMDLGFDQDGIFVRNRVTKEILFHSRHCRQVLLPEEERTAPNGRIYKATPALLIDITSEQEYKISMKIAYHNSPEELKVIERDIRADDFYSLEPLKEVLTAAVVTGNPVFWT